MKLRVNFSINKLSYYDYVWTVRGHIFFFFLEPVIVPKNHLYSSELFRLKIFTATVIWTGVVPLFYFRPTLLKRKRNVTIKDWDRSALKPLRI